MEISCAICMESFGTNCVIATIPCAHVFHEACIKKWHSAQKNCAQCRQKFRAEEIVRLYVSENDSTLKDNNIHRKYQEIILKLKKEMCDLKFHKLNESDLKEENLILKEENLRLQQENHKYLQNSLSSPHSPSCTITSSSTCSSAKNQSALKDNNVDKLKLIELSSEILRLKAENLRLNEENYPFEQSELELNKTILELQEDNNKLSNKLEDLKFHERKVQKMLREEIDLADSKLIEMNFNLNKQIGKTEKAKKQILALEAKSDLADSKLIEMKSNLNTQIGKTKKAKKEILALEAKSDLADSKLIEMNYHLNTQIGETKKAKNEIQALEAIIDSADSKLIEMHQNLNIQIGETKKAKKEILALEAKCLTKVPFDQIPRRKNKRKLEISGELQSKSATIKSPPQKKSKQTAESNPKVTYTVSIPISEGLRSLGLSQVYMYNDCKHSGFLIKEDN